MSYTHPTGFFAAPNSKKMEAGSPAHFPQNSPQRRGFYVRPPHRGGESIISPPPLQHRNALYAALIERAPSWPLCGETPQQAGREESRRPADYALAQRFCQLNPRGRLGVIVLDLDHHHGLNLLDAPPPTYTTINLQSGHQQPGYILLDPVSRHGAAHEGPQRYADDVRRGLNEQLGGDPSFSGFLSRGPLHPDHLTRLVSGRLWTLGELLRDLPPLRTLPRREAVKAAEAADIEGRNCAAFEALRHVAYRLHDQGVTGAALVRQVQHQAEELNRAIFAQHVAGMLAPRELAGIVRSICKWTDANHHPTTGSNRSRTHSRDRAAPLPEAEQRARMRQGQAKGATTRRKATTARLRAAEGELIAAGRLITGSALAELAGVSRPTAISYLQNAAQSEETA